MFIAKGATPQTDAALRIKYREKGASAYRDDKPCEPPGDPTSMVAGWWREGWRDARAHDAAKMSD